MRNLSNLAPEDEWKQRAIDNSLIRIQSNLGIEREKRLIDCLLQDRSLQVPESPASEPKKTIV